MTCAACQATLEGRGHFVITRVAAGGAAPTSVYACSLICLTKWAYNTMAMQGVQLAVGAKGAFDQIKGLLRGGR